MIQHILKTNLIFIAAILLMSASCEKESPEPFIDTNPYHQIMFYNVENLFDTLDQAGTVDEEFMPEAAKEWNTEKLFDKLYKIEKVISEIDTNGWPALIGFCEVESRNVLDMLVATTALKDSGYQIVHKESPDYRGIDVALLYKQSEFELIDYKLWSVWFPFNLDYSTREVLYVKGNLAGLGTIHLFVNHWPSRSGGEIESRPKRIFVAEMLRSKVDSIYSSDEEARIIIMGDLNDEPNDLSVISGLSAYTEFDKIEPKNLYAISKYLQDNSDIGSYKYKGIWNYLDQFVVSSSMLDTAAQFYCQPTDLGIMDRYYLFEEDKTYMGKKPFRTYLGDYYHGGYSDHLPVSLKIRYKN